MLTLITGGAASGKSEYAEHLAAARSGVHIYLATMQPFDEECEQRIQKHRTARAERGFVTIERYRNLAKLCLPEKTAVVLLECLSNLLANEQFSPDGAGDNAVLEILAGIDALYLQTRDLVIVSNEVFADGIGYDSGTKQYLAMLGELNRLIAVRADEIIEVVCGIPIRRRKAGIAK